MIGVRLKRLLPSTVLRRLRDLSTRMRASPPVGDVDLGDLRRTEPVDRRFGLGRGGRPIDRYYIESFLESCRGDIRGRVLEIADREYTSRYGTDVTASDVLSLAEGRGVTFVADLCDPDVDVPAARYDCVICVQTLQFVRDPRRAVTTLARLLRPGGVLLATVPGISQVSRYDADRWGDRWRFTSTGLGELLAHGFAEVSVDAFGNVLAAIALLEGLVVEDVAETRLDVRDRDYDVIVAARAVAT